jgi:hypothetical protein
VADGTRNSAVPATAAREVFHVRLHRTDAPSTDTSVDDIFMALPANGARIV